MSGAMGGSASEEFLATAENGEDTYVRCTSCDYAANVEAVHVTVPAAVPFEAAPAAHVEDTPGTPTIDTLVDHLNEAFPREDRPWAAGDTLKNVLVTLVHPDGRREALAVGVPGDREVDPKRLEAQVHPAEVEAFDEADFARNPALVKGYIGPGALGTEGSAKVRYLLDPRVSSGTAWVTGANEPGRHVLGLVAGRDFVGDGTIEAAEIRDGDPCPRCASPLETARGIEMGHIFQLGRKFATALDLKVLDENGKLATVTMGSYGIGVSRAVAAIVENSHDEKGIVWPRAVSPYDVHVVVAGKDDEIYDAAAAYAEELSGHGLDVLLDDRRNKVSPGVKFKDAELIGVPTILVVGKDWAQGTVELKDRASRHQRAGAPRRGRGPGPGGGRPVTVEAVLFDWGGTLTPWHSLDLREPWLAYVRAAGLPEATADALLAQEDRAWARARDHQRSGTLVELFRAAGVEPQGAAHDAGMVAYEAAWEPHTWTDPDAAPLLEALRAAGLRVGVLSNTLWTRDYHERVLARDGVLHLVDAAVFSSEIAWTKPHPAAFDAVRDRRRGVRPGALRLRRGPALRRRPRGPGGRACAPCWCRTARSRQHQHGHTRGDPGRGRAAASPTCSPSSGPGSERAGGCRGQEPGCRRDDERTSAAAGERHGHRADPADDAPAGRPHGSVLHGRQRQGAHRRVGARRDRRDLHGGDLLLHGDREAHRRRLVGHHRAVREVVARRGRDGLRPAGPDLLGERVAPGVVHLLALAREHQTRVGQPPAEQPVGVTARCSTASSRCSTRRLGDGRRAHAGAPSAAGQRGGVRRLGPAHRRQQGGERGRPRWSPGPPPRRPRPSRRSPARGPRSRGRGETAGTVAADGDALGEGEGRADTRCGGVRGVVGPQRPEPAGQVRVRGQRGVVAGQQLLLAGQGGAAGHQVRVGQGRGVAGAPGHDREQGEQRPGAQDVPAGRGGGEHRSSMPPGPPR